MFHSLRVVAPALVSLALPAQGHGLRAGETVEETANAFPGAEPKSKEGELITWCVRILDAVDHRPIAGALVQVPWHPGGGVVDAEIHFQCVARADEQGFARLPWPAVQGFRDYVFADAPGYAADEECLPGEQVCELRRGVDVPVEVIDYTGRPVADARIELVLGCGHVPCQRSVVADAQGRATLRDIWPARHEDFFVWAPQCQYGAFELRRTWRPGDPPVPIDVVPGCTASGRVVDIAGAPVVGARVGANDESGERQRPWTRTDRNGRFHLVGLTAWAMLAAQPPEPLGLPETVFIAPPPDVERTIVLGKSTPCRDVVVQARAAGGEPAASVRIAATRASDGFTATLLTDEGGRATLAVPVGRYRLRADGELGEFGRMEREIEVGDAGLEPIQLTVPRNPTVHVDASRIRDMTLGITTATQFRELNPNEIDGKDVPVPVGERATFRISMREVDELLVHFIEIPAPGASVVLDGPPSTRVVARFVGPDGKPIPATLSVQRDLRTWYSGCGGPDETATATAEVTTRLTGRLTWVAEPVSNSLARRFGEVIVKAGTDTDLGEIRLAAPLAAELTVELPPDLKPAGCGVHGASGLRSVSENLDDDGKIVSGLDAFGVGDVLWIRPHPPGAVPFCFRVPGPPPWTVRYPTSSLTVSLRGAKDLPITRAVVILDGHLVEGGFEEQPSLRLRGLTAGAHTLVVAERNHLAKVFRLMIDDGDERTLDVELNARN